MPKDPRKLKDVFIPDTTVDLFMIDSSNVFVEKQTREAQTIPYCGDSLVITKSTDDAGYNLTHVRTGCALNGTDQICSSVLKLRQIAIEFWKSLNLKQKRLMKTSEDVQELQKVIGSKNRDIIKKGIEG